MLGCGRDRGADLGGLAELVRFERPAERRVDLVEAVFAEEGQEVPAQAPPIVVLGMGTIGLGRGTGQATTHIEKVRRSVSAGAAP